MRSQHWYATILDGTSHSWYAAAVRAGLSVAVPFYRGSIAIRNGLYRVRAVRARQLPRAVISLGNITAGGTGKTPMVMEIARRFRFHGYHPAVLLRGYHQGPRSSGSDEGIMLSQQLGPSVPVGVGAKRFETAQRLLGDHAAIDVFLLDDGFQHRALHRDLDLVLIDATEPFGHERLLPRGLLREPLKNLRRADAIIVTRADQTATRRELDTRIQELSGKPPIAHAAYTWESFRDNDGEGHSPEFLKDAAVAAICGIGNPGAFEDTLRKHVRSVVLFFALRDHHEYNLPGLMKMLSQAKDAGAQAVVTTDKDWVKWRPLLKDRFPPLKIYRPVLKVSLMDGLDALDALLLQTMQNAGSKRNPFSRVI
jgi:tetraacyldisaccharide 4'-kinase